MTVQQAHKCKNHIIFRENIVNKTIINQYNILIRISFIRPLIQQIHLFIVFLASRSPFTFDSNRLSLCNTPLAKNINNSITMTGQLLCLMVNEMMFLLSTTFLLLYSVSTVHTTLYLVFFVIWSETVVENCGKTVNYNWTRHYLIRE